MIYYSVENTGWSGGVSWFETGGTHMNPLRFNSYNEAVDYMKKSIWDDESVLNADGKELSSTHHKEYMYYDKVVDIVSR
jgi:hypothetical protein